MKQTKLEPFDFVFVFFFVFLPIQRVETCRRGSWSASAHLGVVGDEEEVAGDEDEDGAEVDDGVGDANEQALMLLLREDDVEEEGEDADSIPCSGGVDGG